VLQPKAWRCRALARPLHTQRKKATASRAEQILVEGTGMWALLQVLLAATAVDLALVASPAEHLGSGAIGSVASPAEHLGSGAVGSVFRTPLQSDAATNTTCGVGIGQLARSSMRLAGRRDF